MSNVNAGSSEASETLVAIEALPQRQPRTKRRRHSQIRKDLTHAADISDIETAVVQGSGGQQEGDGLNTRCVQLPLQEYRAAAVADYKFECKSDLVFADLIHSFNALSCPRPPPCSLSLFDPG